MTQAASALSRTNVVMEGTGSTTGAVWRRCTILQCALIFALVPTARPLQRLGGSVLDVIGAVVPALLLGGVLLSAIVWYGRTIWAMYSRPWALTYFLLTAAFGISAALVVDLPIEAYHLPLFGALGIFSSWAQMHRAPLARTLICGVFCIGIAVLDEFLQGLHPERFADPRDVLLNGLSAAMGLVIASALAPRMNFSR